MADFIDQHSAEGKALQQTVKVKLRSYLGEDYNDEVLPLYIVVMLAHRTQQDVVAENLEAFLSENATSFASWLFQHLETASKTKSLRIAGDTERPNGQSAISGEGPLRGQAAAPQAAEDINRSYDRRETETVSLAESGDLSDRPRDVSDNNVRRTSPGAPGNGQRRTRHDDTSRSNQQHQSDRPRQGEEERVRRRYVSPGGFTAEHDSWQGSHHRSHGHVSRHNTKPRDHQPLSGSETGHRQYGRRHHPRDSWHSSGRDDRDFRHESRLPRNQDARWDDTWQYPDMNWERQRWGGSRMHEGRDAEYRYRSLSPTHHHHAHHGDERAVYRSMEETQWRDDTFHHRYQAGDRSEERARHSDREFGGRYHSRAGFITPGGVPPEIDFEAKAQDVPFRYRRQRESHQSDCQAGQPIRDTIPRYRAEDHPDSHHPPHGFSDDVRHTTNAPRAAAGIKLSERITSPVSLSDRLTAGVRLSDRLSPSERLGTEMQHANGERHSQHLTGSAPVAALLPAVVSPPHSDPDDVMETEEHAAGKRATGSPGHAAAGNDMEAIQKQLRKMAGVLEQLRAAARLESAALHAARQAVRQPSVFSRISFPSASPQPAIEQYPVVSSSLRSVTVTSVHPLALEYPAILRAHFGTTGQIIRATVLRDLHSGEPTGKAHVEYDSVLAARKALLLSRSLLLDRIVFVRMKKR